MDMCTIISVSAVIMMVVMAVVMLGMNKALKSVLRGSTRVMEAFYMHHQAAEELLTRAAGSLPVSDRLTMEIEKFLSKPN